MKSIFWTSAGILLSMSLFSCSKISTNSGACASAGNGFYGSQSECQNSIGIGSCISSTVTSSGSNLVCWQSNTQNQNGNTTGGTTTGGSVNGCTGLTTYWTMGAWSPGVCTTGVSQLTRTVSCSSSTCPCTDLQPSTTQSCQPDLYNNVHYQAECTSKGGSVTFVDGNHVCNFSGSSCPSGWTILSSGATAYTITTPTSGQDNTNCYGGRNTVYTGSHSTFTPVRGVESTSFCSWRNCFGCKSTTTIYANITNVACY